MARRDGWWLTVLLFLAGCSGSDGSPPTINGDDAWNQYVASQGADCAAACDADGDYDADGVANREEVTTGRNPACNEDLVGFDACRGAPTTPADNAPRPWEIGDWWEYQVRSTLDGADDMVDLREVVAYDVGDAWQLGVPADQDVNVTFFTHVPALGPVRKSDFAITRHGEFRPMLQFPLEEGRSWTVEVRGTWTATAARANLTILGDDLPGWRVSYHTEGGDLAYEIDWSAAVNWIVAERAFFGAAEPEHATTLTGWGHNHTGPVRFFVVTDLLTAFHGSTLPTSGTDAAGAQAFTAPDFGEWILTGFFYGGSDGNCAFSVITPAQGQQTTVDACDVPSLLRFGFEAMEGDWRMAWALGATSAYVFLEAFHVDYDLINLPQGSR